MGSSGQVRKGKDFERWVAARLREHGWDAERKRQSAEYDDDSDVAAAKMVNPEVSPIHRRLAVECKSQKSMPSALLRDAYRQASECAQEDELPVVVMKVPRTSRALVVLDLDDFLGLFD